MDLETLNSDLTAEQEALDAVCDALDDDSWALPTPSPGWTVADQIAHLTYFDRAAVMAIRDPEGFRDHLGEVVAALEDGPAAFEALTLGSLRELPPPTLLASWRDARRELALAAATLGDRDRVPWYGPDMAAKSFLTARLMEVWAHGQDVCDAVGVTRAATDRLAHIARLGFITRGWTFLNRGEELPTVPVRVELISPSGEHWRFGPDDAAESVEGSAEDFALVVTQRRHIDDTALVVTGDDALSWMSQAQAFAGPPTDPPVPRWGLS
ncbi:MAG: TIGR03084 family metal-binding protein [Microthrixaceae bacterium]